jgi:hypothetical protein
MNQQTVLTTLGCVGSLAVLLAITGPAGAEVNTLGAESTAADQELAVLTQADGSNPIRDALTCQCFQCTGGGRDRTGGEPLLI